MLPASSLAIDIRLLSLPTIASLNTARESNKDSNRELVVIRLQTQDGAVGWGECSALNNAGYSQESALSSFHSLTGDRRPSVETEPMAAAAMEMARLDLRLRREGRSLAKALGKATNIVPAGATIGLMPADQSVTEAARLIKQSYRRIKVKIGPSQIELVPAALRMTFPGIELQVDANGSLDQSHLQRLVSLADLGVRSIEQPFAPNQPDLSADLVSRLKDRGEVAVIADEAAPDLASVQRLVKRKALTAVSIKPPRVGGLSRALALLSWCVSNGISATAGGMLESALGRHSLAAFAASDGLDIVGDVSPSRRWLKDDPWPDLEMSDGMIVLPDSPGVAPLPDQDLIEDMTTYRWSGVL